MSKLYKIILFALVFSTAIFGFYIYKLHALAVEGNNIYAIRCTKTNIPLIDYKNSFLSFADSLKNPKKYSDDEVKEFFYDYIDGMKKYVPEETEWLKVQNEYITRWDFQLIEPEYIKEASGYQWKMYEGYRDEAVYMLAVYDDGGLNGDLAAKFKEARDRRSKYVGLYEDIFDRESKKFDWRNYFGSVPLPEVCNDSNLVIPDTSRALEQEAPAPNLPSSSEITS